MKLFTERISNQEILLSDGATGTNLQQRGLPPGISAEKWVLEKPDAIQRLHEDFIQSGADIILTCTFGGSDIRLTHNGLASNAQEINKRAVDIANKARGNKEIYIAGSMGPLGQMLKPLGLLDESEAHDNYAKQAQFLAEGGVDFLLIETQFDLEEARIAVSAAFETAKLPVICSFSFDRGTRTMMGADPTTIAKAFNDLNLSAIGINCGKSLDENIQALKELKLNTSLPIWFKPNAGLPQTNQDGIPTYSLTPEVMGNSAKSWVEEGAYIIGGCCGTSPEHLKAIADSFK